MQTIDFKIPETGEVVRFQVEEQTSLNGYNYLLVSEDTGSEEEADAYILKETSTVDGDVVYEMVEDDVEFEALARIFSELIEDDLDY